MRDIARFGLTLMIVCIISAAALSFTYQSTSPRIEENRRDRHRKALIAVLPDAQEFKTVEGDEIKGDEEVTVGYSDDQRVGVALKVSILGYGGPIELMVGVNMEGEVSGVEVLSQAETPGLGARIDDPEENFLEQFKGKTIENRFKAKDDIDAISGATISSQAVTDGVKKALELFSEYFGEREK